MCVFIRNIICHSTGSKTRVIVPNTGCVRWSHQPATLFSRKHICRQCPAPPFKTRAHAHIPIICAVHSDTLEGALLICSPLGEQWDRFLCWPVSITRFLEVSDYSGNHVNRILTAIIWNLFVCVYLWHTWYQNPQFNIGEDNFGKWEQALSWDGAGQVKEPGNAWSPLQVFACTCFKNKCVWHIWQI